MKTLDIVVRCMRCEADIAIEAELEKTVDDVLENAGWKEDECEGWCCPGCVEELKEDKEYDDQD